MTSYTGRGVHGQVVHELGARIVGGRLPEGATLDLRAVGDELGVSITVMRESLKVLAGKGLVDARQKRGTFVRPRGHWNLLDPDVIRWHTDDRSGEQLMRNLADVRSGPPSGPTAPDRAGRATAAGRRADQAAGSGPRSVTYPAGPARGRRR